MRKRTTRRPSCRFLTQHHTPDAFDARLVAAELANDAPIVEPDDPIGEREDFIERFRDQ